MQKMNFWKRFAIKAILILSCIFVLIAAFYSVQPQLVTGAKRNLLEIIIEERYPGEGGGIALKSITSITDRKTMNAIYNELWSALPVTETTGEKFYTMGAPLYKLTLNYSNKTDEVRVYPSGAVRFLGRPDYFTVSSSAKAERIISLLERVAV